MLFDKKNNYDVIVNQCTITKKGHSMKKFKKIILVASLSVIAQQSLAADVNASYENESTTTQNSNISKHDRKANLKEHRRNEDHIKPKHQGFGRIGTALENTLTLHPGNAVNALATGDQADTTFGYHKDDEGRIKANRAHTEHNDNKDVQSDSHRSVRNRNRSNDSNDQETTGHWFWKKSKNN